MITEPEREVEPSVVYVSEQGCFEFSLLTLEGAIPERTVLDLGLSTMEKLLSLAPEDPRVIKPSTLLLIAKDEENSDLYIGREGEGPGRWNDRLPYIYTLASLADVHLHIVEASQSSCQCNKQKCGKNQPMSQWCPEALKATAALTGIFQLYFHRYELFYKDWGCQQAWLHLLRLRFHSLAALYQTSPQDTNVLRELSWASLEWENFCRESENHPLFLGANRHFDCKVLELGDIEAELKGITRPDGRTLNRFLADERYGRTRFALMIHEWFLRDRADWCGAVCLVKSAFHARWKGWAWVIALWLSLLFVVAFGGSLLTPWPPLSFAMAGIYGSLGPLAIAGVAWRPLADVLLPRVWAASLVGYIPLLSSKELWLMIYSEDLAWWLIMLVEVGVLLVSFLYLVWEIQRYLGRSPWMLQSPPRFKPPWMRPENWVVTKRALVLFLLSVLITGCSGLIMMDLVGGHLGKVYLGDLPQDWVMPVPINATVGRVYWEVWVVYGPFAIFISIIAQLFWQEKPVTQSE